MTGRPARPHTVLAVIGWLLFPLVPALLGTAYHRTLNFGAADPRDWDGWAWTLQLGPLIGYGFLAGALSMLPERGLRDGNRLRLLLGRRWVAVAVAPWAGFLFWAALYHADQFVQRSTGQAPSSFLDGPDWLDRAVVYGLLVPTLAYGWAFVFVATLVRAYRAGLLGRVCRRAVVSAVGFVGSLFGGFWAATSIWRSYFFDPTIVPVAFLLVALALLGATGCASPTTLGELRRRELFDAMLPAWLIGLALIWRWGSRHAPQNSADQDRRV